MNNAFAIFHLNLAYSSISADERINVIDRCYWPLLDLIGTRNIRIGIELSGWTLYQIAERSPKWLECFRKLLVAGQCELIGSGHSQIIGPLTSYEVNVWNQRLGLEDYEELLGLRPSLALINEMAYSSGIIDVYYEAGYQGLIMDADNIALALHMTEKLVPMPNYAHSGNGTVLPVLWSDSILFQKLQRYAHGDISLADYMSYAGRRAKGQSSPLAIYCNDAEIFDYRPGRYLEESAIKKEGEWLRIADLFSELTRKLQVSWCAPSEALQLQLEVGETTAHKLNSLRQPIPVKKQAKYNISRWAVSGRDDLWLNTLCYRINQALCEHTSKKMTDKTERKQYWRRLCECYASDLRTHITERRWQAALQEIKDLASSVGVATDYSEYGDEEKVMRPNAVRDLIYDTGEISKQGYTVEFDTEGIYLTIRSARIRVVLNLRRGLTVHYIAFARHEFVPIVGTIPHGYFNSIELAADYYTGTTVIEMVAEHYRITDLTRVQPKIVMAGGQLIVSAKISSNLGMICKQIVISNEGECVSLATSFPGWQRPFGTVRVGILTLLPEAFRRITRLAVNNGGKEAEIFALTEDCRHHSPSSTLVSCHTGLGGMNGELYLGDGNKGIKLTWRPADCAAFVMLHHQQCPPSFLTRVIFSLNELDETFRRGGTLPKFQYKISPTLMN